MKRDLICIICPRGCALTVEGEKDNLKVSGNACPKGEKYAIDECINPMRTVTSIVRVENRTDCMVSVKTENPIPKDKIFNTMDAIRNTTVKAPVKIGDIIIKDIFNTNVIATKNISED